MLNGVKVLVVEDVPVVAMDLASILAEAGATVLGPVNRLEPGLSIARQGKIDVVTLDVQPKGKRRDTLADDFDAQGVPFIFITGCDRADLPADHVGRPLVRKPFRAQSVIEAVEAVLERCGSNL